MKILPIFLCLIVSTSAFSKSRVVPGDFYDIVEVDDPQWSPAGNQIVFTTSVPNDKRDGYDKNLWVVGADAPDGGLRQLTFDPGADWAPRWSEDGREILFLSKRGGVPQGWILPTGGGEARCVTPDGVGVGSLRWVPGSRAVSFVAQVPIESKSGPKQELKKPEPGELLKKGIKVVNRVIYFSYGEYIGPLAGHLHTLDLETGKLFQLTSGDRSVGDYKWASDGKRAAVLFKRFPESKDIYETRLAIVKRGGKTRMLKAPGKNLGGLSFRPGSSELIVAKGNWDGLNSVLYRVDVDSGKWKRIDTGFDGEFGMLRWQPDGRRVLAVAEERGNARIWSLDPETFRGRRVTSGRRQIGFHSQMFPPAALSLSPDGSRFVATEVVSDRPRELVVVDVKTGKSKPLTSFNAGWLKKHRTVKAEKFSFKIESGEELDGWIIPPVGLKKGRRYPLVLEIHGGPETMYGEHFMLEFQVLASAGFGVLYINPRGSTGYGESFRTPGATNITLAYGDLMAGVDAAIKRYSWIDQRRLGVAGGSFGGFMTGWIVGHTTRFKAAVAMRGVYNFAACALIDDIPVWVEHVMKKTMWEDPDKYWDSSPVAYAHKVKTPTLVIHSEKDHRCPISEGDQYYRALRLNGVTAELVRYGDEGHGLSRGGRPDRRVDRLERIAAWFKRWL